MSLAQNTREDWSFGKGEAQLLATQGQASPEALAAPSSATSRPVGSVGHRSLSTLAGRRALSSLATSTPRVGGGPAGAVVGKLGLVAACGASAFLGGALTRSKLGPSQSQ